MRYVKTISLVSRANSSRRQQPWPNLDFLTRKMASIISGETSSACQSWKDPHACAHRNASRPHVTGYGPLIFSPDGTLSRLVEATRTAFVYGRKNMVRWYEGHSKWFSLCVLDEAQRRTVRCVKWSHCGRMLAATSFDSTTAIWQPCWKRRV